MTNAALSRPAGSPPAVEGPQRRTRSGAGGRRGRPAAGHLFVSVYVVLLMFFGIGPALYSLYLAFTNEAGSFAGVSNFVSAAKDFRFLPAVGHVAVYLIIWLLSLMIFVVLLALIVHRLASNRTRAVLRFAYYVPGALAGASSVLLWLFVLDPSVSPVAPLLRAFGFERFTEVIAPGNLPVIFAVIAFWTGAGGWVVILYGALNTVSSEVMEAAKVDGAGAVQTALHIQLPMLRKWIAYMLILSLAAGTQLFVEPQLVSQASFGVVGNDYSVNQLSYLFAFSQNDFNGSAAISIVLLVVSLSLAGLFVAKGRMFEVD